MAVRDKKHLFIPIPPTSEPFTLSSSGGGSEPEPFSGDRMVHGRRLRQEFIEAIDNPDAGTDAAQTTGTYITFESFPGLELALKSFDPQARGEQPELVAVSEQDTPAGNIQVATVFVPDGKKAYFLKRLDKYVESSDQEKAKHAALIDAIASIRRATIRELWTDAQHLFPTADTTRHWWEVWLRHRDGAELARITAFAEQNSLRTSEHYLGFGDRTVLLVQATVADLTGVFEALDDIAELRRPHDVASLLVELSAFEQSEWVDELRGRLQTAEADAPAVCILDTGVQESHPLLQDSLNAADIHVANPLWPARPSHGHATEMAGLALYSDLHGAIVSAHAVRLRHRLESVKFLPDEGSNDRDLYGAITARSVDRPEIQAPSRLRVFMLAVTAPRHASNMSSEVLSAQAEDGKPTSWSATVDALAYGRSIDDSDPRFTYLDRDQVGRRRLFVISAGNIRDVGSGDDHLARSDVEPVEDPGQSWNALTVGAFTDKDDMSGAPSVFAGYRPLVQKGQLAAVSRTSVSFDRKKWPFKPEVVAEGGNVAVLPGSSTAQTPENLALLTTRLQRQTQGVFTTTRDTSAATAQVASMAAQIMADYPSLRMETVRALIVHSAEWTPAMWDQILSAPNRTERVSRLRRYGMGVPQMSRALYSAADALTLIAESQIRPFEREGNSSAGKVREMNLHALPWPKAELEALGEVDVRMRVTLSYFIEPNPSSRGWTGRYIYPSHGLRFAVRRPQETIDDFRKRINTRARADGEKRLSLSSDSEKRWLFGTNQQQSAGSLHTDVWTGPAVELASKEAVAIYPVAGWWKDRPSQDQSSAGVHYSLIVGIESPSVEVDLWTPVSSAITAAISVEI